MPPSTPKPGQSLGDLNPKLAAQWHQKNNITPFDVTFMSNVKVWWKCPVESDHEWEAQVSSRSKGYGCPCCKGSKVVPSNCLATLRPDLLAMWHPCNVLQPDQLTTGSKKKALWKCPVAEDHEWSSEVHVITSGVGGCPCCWGNKVVPSNCLATTSPELAAQWHAEKNKDLTPNDVTIGSHKTVWWKCKKDHEWVAVVNNRRRGDGCPRCRESTGEKAVATSLDDLGLLYKRQFLFDNCRSKRRLPFDFLVVKPSNPPKVCIIEYHGEQHYRPVEMFGGLEAFQSNKKRDQIKEDFCRSRNLPLLVIPYSEFANVKKKVQGFIRDL